MAALEFFPLHPAVLLLVGIPAIMAIPFAVSKLAAAGGIGIAGSPPRRILIATSLAILASMIVGLAIGGVQSDKQVFESFGDAKRIALPITYLIFLAVMLVPYQSARPYPRTPLWWGGFAALVTVSTAMALLLPRQQIGLKDLAQGLALTAGILVFSHAGFRASEWTRPDEMRLMSTLAVFAVVSAVADIPLGPFIAVEIPTAAGLLYLGIRSWPRNPIMLLLGVGLTIHGAASLIGHPDASIAVLTQAATCAALLIVLLIPRGLRLGVAIGGSVLALAAAWRSGVWTLMLGDGSGTTDVTLSHRAHEAASVGQLLEQNVASLLFGVGPSATVDLRGSPDASTLLASGRVLSAVDDVHFLTSWILLKFGLLGLIWLVFLVAALAREVKAVLSEPKPDPFDGFLLFFVAAGIVTALPAATHFFVNPLPSLFLGVLYARRVGSKARAISASDTIGVPDVSGRRLA